MCSLSNINSSIKHTYYSLSLDYLCTAFSKNTLKKLRIYTPPYEN